MKHIILVVLKWTIILIFFFIKIFLYQIFHETFQKNKLHAILELYLPM